MNKPLESREQLAGSTTDGFKGRVEEIELRWQVMGLLPYPASWVGQAELRATGIEPDLLGRVDEASGHLRLNRGRLESPDFRLSGPSATVQGNGWLGGGPGALVARFTLSATSVGGVRSRCGEFHWQALPPGAMAYADLTLWGDEHGVWWVELGEGGAHVRWDRWTRCLRSGPELGR